MGRTGSRRRRDPVSGLRKRPCDSWRRHSGLPTHVKDDKATRVKGDKLSAKGEIERFFACPFPRPLVLLSPCLLVSPSLLFFTFDESKPSPFSVKSDETRFR